MGGMKWEDLVESNSKDIDSPFSLNLYKRDACALQATPIHNSHYRKMFLPRVIPQKNPEGPTSQTRNPINWKDQPQKPNPRSQPQNANPQTTINGHKWAKKRKNIGNNHGKNIMAGFIITHASLLIATLSNLA